ncbi:Fusaric acid resistance protein-like-domain-containing protein [Myxozyma melibiosi]|uniref:Fusaric acid resistance protein-like-domain-containing protein n=1 Tax=Myxozyma melibiosi TaxID=54550 RepID=A0ABR1FC71_9ASCO
MSDKSLSPLGTSPLTHYSSQPSSSSPGTLTQPAIVDTILEEDSDAEQDDNVSHPLAKPGARTGSTSSSSRPPYRLVRNFSLILPDTGERVRRQITLDPFDSVPDGPSSGRQLLMDDDEDTQNHYTDADESAALLSSPHPDQGHTRHRLIRSLNKISSACDSAGKYLLTFSVIRWIYLYVFFQQFSRPLKCALTYYIASFAVFSSTISQHLGSGDGKHLTATVTVYFHPSRTLGSMIEATMFAEIGLFYGVFLSFCAMHTSAFFKSLDLLPLGHAIVLVVFGAGGLGSIALMKRKVDKQTFNTACSLASTQFVRILVREGAVQQGVVAFGKMWQVTAIVHLGILISATVCFLIFPTSAITKLKKGLNQLMDTYSHMLSIVARSFLAGTDVTKTEIEELFKSARGLVVSLDGALQESKFEHFLRGTEAEYFLQARLVKSVQSLMQHIGGLRSSLVMEWSLTNLDHRQTRSSCAEIFDIFVYYLGPPMKSLTFTVKSIMEALPFSDETNELQLNAKFAGSLEAALDLFSSARTKALREIYSQEVFTQADRETIAIHLEKVAATCGQFSHGLEDLAREVVEIIEIMTEYDDYVSKGRPKSWHWLMFWRANPTNVMSVSEVEEEEVTVPPKLAHLFSESNVEKYTNEEGHIPWSLRLWRSLRLFRRTDVRFGIKVGLGALFFLIPAYLNETKDFFRHYRGEWGLVAFVLMMNISIGGTTNTIVYRLSGTFMGCYSAWLVWYFFGDSRTALSLTGFCIAFVCFCIILGWKQNSAFGRFILLAFNLTALYSYSLSQNDIDDGNEDEGGVNPIVSEIAFHRLVSVSSGILVAIFVTMYIWPNSARQELKRKLSILWIRMGLIWKCDPLSSLTHVGEAPKPYVTIQDERKLQKSLLKLQGLVGAASNEFRLKGPFPSKNYDFILKTTQGILDAFHNMNAMIIKDLNASEREAEIIRYTVEERSELGNRLFLLFYLLASGIRLGLPIPNHLPNTVHARDRMIVKINEYRMKSVSQNAGTDDDFVLFYSFILATMAINDGLLQIIAALQEIYGAIEEETLSI